MEGMLPSKEILVEEIDRLHHKQILLNPPTVRGQMKCLHNAILQIRDVCCNNIEMEKRSQSRPHLAANKLGYWHKVTI